MEQITLTKQELAEIVQQEISKRLDGVRPIKPMSIFSDVRLQEDDIRNVNEKIKFTKLIKTPYRGSHYKPLSLKKFPCGGNDYFNGKVCDDHIHDHIRKLTLAVFGVTKNSDLSEEEFKDAVLYYQYFKDMYLDLYKRRISKLTIDDFE
ncbi:hypothetical protein WL278_07745 [Staphylococcus caprae]|uniref:hypothetical protein n=1 Tax=Staphylococcus caprae TaxID=29380 RepID=UPI000A2760FA|nr:hypothetical protein [Staphylococcus caprae]ARM67828.1 hypothetical protein [Staphylococcus phage IME1323_01]MBX5322536.1 hypothetical protein [Staphylococcus caprae]PAK65182.1 hypothetical protein B9K00_04270 [Staphylococcus caprae]